MAAENGCLTIGSSEGIALGNGGPLRSRSHENIGRATQLSRLLALRTLNHFVQMSFDTRVIGALPLFFYVI